MNSKLQGKKGTKFEKKKCQDVKYRTVSTKVCKFPGGICRTENLFSSWATRLKRQVKISCMTANVFF